MANAPNCYLISDLGFGKRRGQRGGSVLGGGAHPSGGPGARALGAPGRLLGPRRAAPPRLPRCPLRPTRAVVASQSTETLPRSAEVLGGSRLAIAVRLWLSLLSQGFWEAEGVLVTWWSKLHSRPSWIVQARPHDPAALDPRTLCPPRNLYPGCTSLPLPTTFSFFHVGVLGDHEIA